MLAELALGIPYKVDEKVAQRFGMQVLDRFRNPSLEHQWISITVQYTSKMKMRNVPTLLNYYQIFNCVPEYVALGFAAYLLFMKAEKEENGKYYGIFNGNEYLIQDDKAEYFYAKWQKLAVNDLVVSVLSDKNLWEADLTAIPQFTEKVQSFIQLMIQNGVKETLSSYLNKGELV
jgi:tagaturonate reductase